MLLKYFQKKIVYDYQMQGAKLQKIQETQTSVTSTTKAE